MRCTACETIAHLTEHEEFQPTAASRRALENLTLASRVAATLARDPRTREATLDVVADDGFVTISGETRLQPLNEAIQAVAGPIDGVTEVRAQVVFLPTYQGT